MCKNKNTNNLHQNQKATTYVKKNRLMGMINLIYMHKAELSDFECSKYALWVYIYFNSWI